MRTLMIITAHIISFVISPIFGFEVTNINNLDPSLYSEAIGWATPMQAVASNSLLQPATPFVSIAFVLPHQNLTNQKIREQLRKYLAPAMLQAAPVMAPQTQLRSSIKSALPAIFITPTQFYSGSSSEAIRPRTSTSGLKPNVLPEMIAPRFQINPVYTTGLSVSETVKRVFCSSGSRGLNALLILIDKKVQTEDEAHLANFLTSLAHEVGISSMIWSSAAHQIETDAALVMKDEQRGVYSKKRVVLLAPSMRDQALAILDFLRSQSQRVYCIIANTQTPGADDFISLVSQLGDDKRISQRVDIHEGHSKSRLAHVVKLPGGRISTPSKWRKVIRNELMFIRDSTRARAIILWSSVEEANDIFGEARILGMTAESYLWVGGKPLLGENMELHIPTGSTSSGRRLNTNIVPGTVVASYETTFEAQLDVIKSATELWTKAVRALIVGGSLTNASEIAPANLCEDGKPLPWKHRDEFYQHLRDIRRDMGDEHRSLLRTGRSIILSYMDNGLRWRRLGNWTAAQGFVANESNYKGWMLIRGTVKASDRSVFLNIVTLEEPPYIVYGEVDHRTGLCPNNGVRCELAPTTFYHAPVEFETHHNYTPQDTGTTRKSVNQTHMACCWGLCIDLLQRLSIDIGFRYHLFEVRDRKWGGRDKATGEWNGLVRALLDDEADLVLTSLKINQERSQAIDFTLPFLETGITIMVSVRPGAISPYALLEPFSPTAWCAILLGCVNAMVLSSYLFEYFSEKLGADIWRPPREIENPARQTSRYSVPASLWLAWAMLFKAAVKVQLPKTLGAKLMTAVWGMFCVIFASSYMANLAVFMITKDDFYDFSGLEDYRLKNPYSKQPPYRFGTISSGATEAFIKTNFPYLHEYMRQFNQSSASAGIRALKLDKLDAFIYDATVLEYKSSHDPECELNVVGKWYAMTGYGIGFPRGSTWLPIFEKFIVEYQYNGFLQRLSEYWLSGACKYRKQAESNKSFQLGYANFTSAFVLLLMGVFLCFIILCVEYIISKYLIGCIIRKKVELRERRRAIAQTVAAGTHLEGDQKPKPVTKMESAATGLLAGLLPNAMTVRCKNCGGRGHIATICSSHPQTHLMIGRENLGLGFDNSHRFRGTKNDRQYSSVGTSPGNLKSILKITTPVNDSPATTGPSPIRRSAPAGLVPPKISVTSSSGHLIVETDETVISAGVELKQRAVSTPNLVSSPTVIHRCPNSPLRKRVTLSDQVDIKDDTQIFV